MRGRSRHQVLPAAGPERERLRQKGQFWTPEWVARAMVEYVMVGDEVEVFDPAVGAGAFFLAARAVAAEHGVTVRLSGSELDPAALAQAREAGVTAADLTDVEIRDFALAPPGRPLKAIVANPPYVRHHRLTAEAKLTLRSFAVRRMGAPIDGRAGLHVYFLLRGLDLLAQGGRLAFILPADTCEGVFAPSLWAWIAVNYRVECVVTFAPEASPFPAVDTNPVIVLIRKVEPAAEILWARCLVPEAPALARWVCSGFREAPGEGEIEVTKRDLAEVLQTGLSRPFRQSVASEPTLGRFANVMRGIVTGANDFFFMNSEQAAQAGLYGEILRRAVGRTRDVCGEEIRDEDLARLDAGGRPTWLLAPDGRGIDAFPAPVRRYLEHGEALGLPGRAIMRARRPWYKMESREVPPFLFAYLGRRSARFIRNSAGVLPLTGFLCVFPKDRRPEAMERLWSVLRHPDTVKNLALVGKSYGDGAIKVEPRALERLPLPEIALAEAGLSDIPPSHQAGRSREVAPPRQLAIPF